MQPSIVSFGGFIFLPDEIPLPKDSTSNEYGIVFLVTAYVITDLIGHKARPVMDY